MGAVKNKMDLILVPESNYEEAMQVKEDFNYDIDIISVKTFEEAVNYLKEN
jgi:PDZ domain-containing secreted protein